LDFFGFLATSKMFLFHFVVPFVSLILFQPPSKEISTALKMIFEIKNSACDAQSLLDGVCLAEGVVMPWVGYGTYRLGKGKAYDSTLEALRVGYRCIDTAFIYANEQTEIQVGDAIKAAVRESIVKHRNDIFVITKQWRNYHGYENTLRCLNLSLERLQLDTIDLYLIHWPGPAYERSQSRGATTASDGPWASALITEQDMAHARAETWHAMEDSLMQGKVRAIGVSNFAVRHLERLKQTAKIWPPAVNQVECHPLYPNEELRHYCQKEGIVLQAYAALGGQDGTKAKWKELLNGKTLLQCQTVLEISNDLGVSPAQVLLRYALQRNCAVTPKTTSIERMKENTRIFHFCLSSSHMDSLARLKAPGDTGRLCWRTDPLRLLDFD
jgi:diketogulonate reductase-like aldo/keto reductase